MIKLLTFDNLFPPTASRLTTALTTAITFSRQSDSGSRASTTLYGKNLVLVVVLVSESKKALYLGSLANDDGKCGSENVTPSK